MNSMLLFHGSEQIIKEPKLILGKENNDYGKGFYCTEQEELAKEWACKNNKNGFVNKYEINITDLRILNLSDSKYNVLNWIALLLKYRTFRLSSPIAIDSRDYLINHFSIKTKDYDIIIGYRANDSYFQYAQSFVENTLPLRGLRQALFLGQLGMQTVLVSEKAFKKLRFISAETVDCSIYYPIFVNRDKTARETYKNEISKSKSYRDDIFALDILREEMKNDDSRLQ